jgi:hypothetical protein
MPSPVPQDEMKVKAEDMPVLARQVNEPRQYGERCDTPPESDAENGDSLAELQVRAYAYAIFNAQR